MPLKFCADSPSFGGLFQLRFEALENRKLLSASQLGESDLSYQFVVLSEFDGHDIAEFWAELNRREITSADDDITSVSGPSQPEETNQQPPTPVPAIPIDNTIDPFTDCPGLDDDFCLPGDADRDGNVGFLDFLRLSHSFGMHDASWEDGDFDGDGRVTFGDFLILSSNVG